MSPPTEYIVAYTLSPLKKGQIFKEWPLHITIVPWFIIPDGNVEEAAMALAEVVCKHDVMVMKGDESIQFGPTTPVITTKKSDELQNLHDSLAALIVAKEWKIGAKRYTGKGFRPHITGRKHRLTADVEVRIDTVVFVSAPIADKRKRLKTVIDVLPLGGQNA